MEKYQLPGKNDWHNFEVEGEAYREAQITAALGRRPKLNEEIEQIVEALLVPEPDNPYDANAISVRVHGHVVGYLAREAASVYSPIFHRISASDLVAATTARIWAVMRESWDGDSPARFHSAIRIYLPEVHDILPLNSPNHDHLAVLPWGSALQVTGEDKHFEHLFNYVPKNGEGMVILTMHRLIRTLKNGTEKNLVEVRLDGERVGQLTATTSSHFLPSVAHAADMGKELGVWARIKGSGLAAELVIQGARATELSDEWLERMPTFVRLAPEAGFYDVPPAFTELERVPTKRAPATSELPPSVGNQGSPRGGSVPAAGLPIPSRSTVKPMKGSITVTEKDRQYGPGTHRAAGIGMIVIGVLVGALLGAIPAVGPFLFIACLALGIMGNARSRKIAKVLDGERTRSSSSG